MGKIQMSYKRKIEELDRIGMQYFTCKRNVLKKRLSCPDKSGEFTNPYLIFINRVNCAFSSLSPIEQNVINNDFFYQGYPNWWEANLSKPIYEKVKKEAIDKFLEHFYEID